MTNQNKRQEDQAKLEELEEQEDQVRDESLEGEMREEMAEKSPGEAVRDDLKASKEQVKEWFKRDDSKGES